MAGLGPTYGRGAMTNFWKDGWNSDCVLAIGGNPAENHPVSMFWVNGARERNGAKLIVVDPRINRTAAVADIYAPLRSGTDITFLGGLINYTIQNKLYNEEYVKYFTNALTLINPEFKGPADLDGLFSGYNAEKGSYDTTTWQYQTEKKTVTVKEKDANGVEQDVEKEVSVVMQAESLEDPNCVFTHLTKHYARYTPEMVEKICGTPKDQFLKVAETFCATGAPNKSGVIMYAMGQTQHTVGTQNVRSMAMLQLLLGNIGIPGGGVNALRGESNVQGSTDMALLFHLLPGYLGAPSVKEVDLKTYSDTKYDKTSYWVNGPRFFTTLMKAWYGSAANKDNDYAYDYVPKSSGNYSWISLFEAMHAGTIKGLLCMGQNPAVAGPNARLERKALNNLDWLVVMDLFETETASFWKAPGVNPADVNTEVFMLPAVDAMEKAGSIVTSGRRINWRPAVARGPGQAKPDIWIIDRLYKAIKAAYAGSTATKDRPILDLAWGYETTKDEPDPELIAREINGYALDDVKDAKGTVLVAKGRVIPGFGTIASAANPDAIACGCWIYSGYWADADDGSGVLRPAVKRRGQKDPGGLGIYPYWGFQWPANRKILYNRCSARPDGTPWSEKKKLIWWDANADSGTKDADGNPVLGKWVGYDVPDFAATKKPDAKANPAGTGLAAQSGTDPFIMKADGKGWLFAPKGLAEGPLPEHYEPLESPVKNPMSSVQVNPVVKLWNTDADVPAGEVGDRVGTVEEFPIVCTTFRLTEHWQTGTMSRTLPWLAECQPEMFLEISHELAEERGIECGDQVVVKSARGEIEMVALVTGRWKPLTINGQLVHQVGMPWHFGWQGLATGAVANDLTPHVGDGNTMIPEYKAFLVDVRKKA